jgi:hypothetical protein
MKIFIAFIAFCLMLYIAFYYRKNNNKSKVELILGVKLNTRVVKIYYKEWRINQDLSFHYAYSKFSCTKDDYEKIILIQKEKFGKGDLPYKGWALNGELNLEWWTPLDQDNESTFFGVGDDFQVKLKLENGYLYMITKGNYITF